MDFSFLVVPVQINPTIFLTFPVLVNNVVLLDDVDEMVCMFFANVLDPEIIYYEGEADWPCVVFPKSGSQLTLVISMFV